MTYTRFDRQRFLATILGGSTNSRPTMPTIELSDYMTTTEAAKVLGFHLRSVNYMARNKTLEAVKLGRTWLVSRKSVGEYLAKTRGMSKYDPRRGTEAYR
jgi:excisionase family DNA binding protein